MIWLCNGIGGVALLMDDDDGKVRRWLAEEPKLSDLAFAIPTHSRSWRPPES